MHSQTQSKTESLRLLPCTASQSTGGRAGASTRSLHMINACNEIIIRVTDEGRMLADMCQTMVMSASTSLLGLAMRNMTKSEVGASGRTSGTVTIT